MIRNIMLKLIDVKKAIKFLITMYALTVETNQYAIKNTQQKIIKGRFLYREYTGIKMSKSYFL